MLIFKMSQQLVDRLEKNRTGNTERQYMPNGKG